MTSTDTTAVQKRTELSPQQKAVIEERRAHGMMVQQIKGTVWAKEFDSDTIRAVANWAKANGVEPVTEIDVLGGRLYLNARYYERTLSHLVGAGLIDYYEPRWCHVDKRLEALADAGDVEAKELSRRRMLMRIEHNLPDEADAACVYVIKHRNMAEAITGAKAHIPGRKRTIKKKDGGSFTVDADPVGDQAPMETIETRACRRAMLKLKEAFPDVRMANTKDDNAIDVNANIQAGHEALKANEPKQITPATSTLDEESQVEDVLPIEDEMTDAEIAAQDAAREGKLL